MMENGTVRALTYALIRLPVRKIGLSLSRGRAWLAFVSLCPVVLDLGV